MNRDGTGGPAAAPRTTDVRSAKPLYATPQVAKRSFPVGDRAARDEELRGRRWSHLEWSLFGGFR